jgi:hypothetical protein
MLYGQWLNRPMRVKLVLLTYKPLSNLVEAHITRETGEGLSVPPKNAPPQGDWCPERIFMEDLRELWKK